MNKWLEYHEAVERRIMEMMRPDAPNPMYEQGWQDYTQGRYREAAGQFADSARVYEEAGAADGLNYARTLYALGELYLLWEEEDEFSDSDGVKSLSEKARKAYCDARDIYERHDLTDQQQIELSFLYDQIALEDLSKEKYADTLSWYQKSREIRERVLGAGHAYTAESYNDIGNMYYVHNDYDAALEWYFKAHAVNERVLGRAHPQTALDCGNIAYTYKDKGDYAAALKWKLLRYRLMLEYGEDPEDIELETKQMYDLYQKINPRKWFQRPKPQPFNDWLYEQLSGQPD